MVAALLAEEPQLFISEVAWSAAAFRAREVPDADLRASLECLRYVLGEELPAAAGKLPQRYLELGIEALESPSVNGDSAPGPESNHLGLVYLEAALSGDRPRAVDAVLAAVDGGGEITAAFEALIFAQRQVGEMWHARQLGVVQEHVVTETTRTVITLLTAGAGSQEANGKAVMVAPAPGNSHDLGARFVAAFFEMEGWRTVHLAEPASNDDLALGLEAFEPDLLALSMSLSTQLGETMELVKQLRAEHPNLKILVGGRSLTQSPQLCERIGADAWAETAADAARIGGELVGLTPTTPD